jgi:ferrous iron transport protein B
LEKIILVGNPNVGKSVIFNYLTNKYVSVSNYPGTTVEITSGITIIQNTKYEVIDTPGVNSLVPMSEDERVTRDILMGGDNLLVVQVIDAKNLRRGLLITLQLMEMELPLMVVLNMEDEAMSRGISIDDLRLSYILGAPVVSTVATRRKGLGKIKEELVGLRTRRSKSPKITYPSYIEKILKEVENILPPATISKRSLATMLLSGDVTLRGWLHQRVPNHEIERIETFHRKLQGSVQESVGFVMSRRRLRRADEILREVMSQFELQKESKREALSRVLTHSLWGILILFCVLFLLYEFVGVLGAGISVDFLEGVVFERWIIPWLKKVVSWIPSSFVQDLFVGEYGVFTMALTYAIAIVMPIVGFFFLAFGLMEDTGYLPRLAVVCNRAFKLVGLNAKAVLPMVLGLGCATMATMTTRILESKRDRIVVTFLLALGVPCSAQLGVVMGMLSHLSHAALLVWVGVVTLVLMVTGSLASRLIPGEGSDFILEIPPLRIPTLGNILMKTLARIQWYLKEAVPLFILGTLVLFALDRAGGIPYLERIAAPGVEKLLGLPPEATKAFLVGFLRRDYGAAGLYLLAKEGRLDPIQILVSMVTITLFVPCIANFFMMVKERGLVVALLMVLAIIPIAFGIGGALNYVLRNLHVTF